jgi:hypothetical protein
MGGIAIFGLVVPQAKPALDRWIFARASVFSSTGCEVSSTESFCCPDVSITDVIGGAGVSEVRVDA